MTEFQSGGFPTVQPFVHFDEGITLVGKMSDKHCAIGAIMEEDLATVMEEMENRANAIAQQILDGMKESGAV